jgi:hypothetical protein
MLSERSVLRGRTDEKYFRLLKERCREPSRKETSAILDEFVKITGYHRQYATALLNGRRQQSQIPSNVHGEPYAALRRLGHCSFCRSCSITSIPGNCAKHSMPSCGACTNRVFSKSALSASRG